MTETERFSFGLICCLFPQFSQGFVDGKGYVFSPILVVAFGEIATEMYATTFLSGQGPSGHGLSYGQHVLTFPSSGIVENLVHNVTAPKLDYLDSFG